MKKNKDKEKQCKSKDIGKPLLEQLLRNKIILKTLLEEKWCIPKTEVTSVWMRKMTNLSLSIVPGDVSKKQLTKIYGTEFQRVITHNNSQLLSILIISIDRTIICPQLLDKTHSLEPLGTLKQPIKSNPCLDSTET